MTAQESTEADQHAAPVPGLQGAQVQLAAAVFCMVAMAPVQYAWTLFTTPLAEFHGWSLPAVQIAFTCFVVAQTFPQPLDGLFVDKFGPRAGCSIGAVLIGVGMMGMAASDQLPALYASYAVAGLGVGIINAGAIGTAIRWYPTRRGFALGLVTAGFGAGAALVIPIIGAVIESQGVNAALAWSGVLIGCVVLVAAQVLRHPPSQPETSDARGARLQSSDHGESIDTEPWKLLGMPRFWLIFTMFAFMATGLLYTIANTRPAAVDWGLTSMVVVIAVTLQQVMNGLSRVIWGWVSDRHGRQITMFVAFGLNGTFLLLLAMVGDTPVPFVLLTSLALFTAGEIFALFPALAADTFGSRYAAANQGMLYVAKGVAGLVGVAAGTWVAVQYGWSLAFTLVGCLALTASLGALVPVQASRVATTVSAAHSHTESAVSARTGSRCRPLRRPLGPASPETLSVRHPACGDTCLAWRSPPTLLLKSLETFFGALGILMLRQLDELKTSVEAELNAPRGAGAEVALDRLQLGEEVDRADRAGDHAATTADARVPVQQNEAVPVRRLGHRDRSGWAHGKAHRVLALKADRRPGPALEGVGRSR